MVTMTTKRQLAVDFDWIGPLPSNSRQSGESNSHYSFFVCCIQCDKRCDRFLLKCDSVEELKELYRRYAARLTTGQLPFDMREEDFEQLAINTWQDSAYQSAKRKQ